ncbi:MAG: hypothetical protein ACK5H0_09135 [Bacteroidota bacterium]|jgi:hypothetical protein
MLPNEVGDFLGGIAEFVSSTITVILVDMVWVSERKDDRNAAFMTSFMVLLEIHVAETERVLTRTLDDSYYRWFWTVNFNWLIACKDPQTRMLEAKRLFDECYNEIASCFVPALRLLR